MSGLQRYSVETTSSHSREGEVVILDRIHGHPVVHMSSKLDFLTQQHLADQICWTLQSIADNQNEEEWKR